MRDTDRIATVVREWVEKAEEDWRVAGYLLRAPAKCPVAITCFNAQQSIEKYIKAMLAFRGTDVPKTHDIKRVLALLPPSDRPELSAAEQSMLTDYATIFRYPGEHEPLALADARHAVALARRVRSHARKVLPRRCSVIEPE